LVYGFQFVEHILLFFEGAKVRYFGFRISDFGFQSGDKVTGFSVFDVPVGIKNLKYAANQNISTHKLNFFFSLQVKMILNFGLLPPASAGGNKEQINSGALAQKITKV
jgi:hypothetical protein